MVENHNARSSNQHTSPESETILETALDGFLIADKTGKFLAVNDAYCKISGYSREVLLKMNMLELEAVETSKETRSNVKEMMEKGKGRFETKHKRKDGKIVDVEASITYSNIDGGRFYAFFRDITERKQTDESERKNAEELADIYNNTPCGYHSIDKNGFFVRINKTELSWLGYSADELIGKKRVADVLTPESVEIFKVNFPRLMSTGRLKDVEVEFVRKDGSVLPILLSATTVKDSAGNFLMTRSTLYDITEIRQISEEKRQASEKLVTLIAKLEERNKQNLILSEMREMLQACTTVSEIPQIVKGSMQKLFPHAGGALFIMSPSRSDLESVARWNNFPEDIDDNVFSPDACWSLRRGRVHMVDDLNVGPVCGHLKNLQTTAYVCIPLVAKGDILGILHLRTALDHAEEERNKTCEYFRELSSVIAEYLSLSIANIKLSEKLAYESIRDPLTGLFNRRYMEETLRREILRAERKKTQINILMGDIDHFKLFNDRYGHAAGDTLLAHVGEFFKSNIRGGDVACRYGGEEFILFLPESSLADTVKRAEQMLQDIKKLEVKYIGERLAPISFSFGISTYPDNGDSAENLLRKADEALYRAKQEGRDRVVVSS